MPSPTLITPGKTKTPSALLRNCSAPPTFYLKVFKAALTLMSISFADLANAGGVKAVKTKIANKAWKNTVPLVFIIVDSVVKFVMPPVAQRSSSFRLYGETIY